MVWVEVGKALVLWTTGQAAKTLVGQQLTNRLGQSHQDQTLQNLAEACVSEAQQEINAGSLPQPADWLFAISNLVEACRLLDLHSAMRDAETNLKFGVMLDAMLLQLRPDSDQNTTELFRQAFQQNPHDADIWNSLGWAYWKSGDADQAIFCFDVAHQENPQHVMALVNRGIVLKNQGNHAASLHSYEKARTIQDADPEDFKKVWHNMAVLYWETDDLGNADRCASEAVKIDPNYFQAIRLQHAMKQRNH